MVEDKSSKLFFRIIGVVAVSVVTAMGGCSSTSLSGGETHVSSPGVNVGIDVDRKASTIIVPSERYMATEKEMEVLTSATSVALAECTRDKDLDIRWTGQSSGILYSRPEDIFIEFGPWVKETTSRYGFTSPYIGHKAKGKSGTVDIVPGAREQSFRAMDANSKYTDAQMEKMWKECGDHPSVKKFNVESVNQDGPWVNELSNTRMVLFDDPRAKAIAGELGACFVKKGLKMSSEAPGYVDGINGFDEPTQESIEAALKAVECQEETDATPRLAQVWADLQAPIIKKYAKELAAQRRVIDERIAEAKKYVHAHPELLEPPSK
ncbi:hypothetical protein [Arcanobacterium haemolyticum]